MPRDEAHLNDVYVVFESVLVTLLTSDRASCSPLL